MPIDDFIFRQCRSRWCAYRWQFLSTNFISITKTKVISWLKL